MHTGMNVNMWTNILIAEDYFPSVIRYQNEQNF